MCRTEIKCNACVDAIRIRKGSACGILINSAQDAHTRPEIIHGSKIILASGTFENARLVLTAFADVGIPHSQLVGLQDHLVFGVVVQVPLAHVSKWDERLYYVPAERNTPYNLFINVLKGKKAIIDCWLMIEKNPLGLGEVSLVKSQNAKELVVMAGICTQDYDSLTAARSRIESILKETFGICYNDFLPSSLRLGEQWRLYGDALRLVEKSKHRDCLSIEYSIPLGGVDHEGGLLSMGRYTTTQLQVRGVSGLYAIGPCVFPRMGSANPSLTSLALARYLATSLCD